MLHPRKDDAVSHDSGRTTHADLKPRREGLHRLARAHVRFTVQLQQQQRVVNAQGFPNSCIAFSVVKYSTLPAVEQPGARRCAFRAPAPLTEGWRNLDEVPHSSSGKLRALTKWRSRPRWPPLYRRWWWTRTCNRGVSKPAIAGLGERKSR